MARLIAELRNAGAVVQDWESIRPRTDLAVAVSGIADKLIVARSQWAVIAGEDCGRSSSFSYHIESLRSEQRDATSDNISFVHLTGPPDRYGDIV